MAKRAERVCLKCGAVIREGAWGSSKSNFAAHVAAHERDEKKSQDKGAK